MNLPVYPKATRPSRLAPEALSHGALSVRGLCGGRGRRPEQEERLFLPWPSYSHFPPDHHTWRPAATAGVGTGRDQARGSVEVQRQLYLHLPHLKECCQGQTLSLTGMLSLEFAGLNHKCKQTRVNAQ